MGEASMGFAFGLLEIRFWVRYAYDSANEAGASQRTSSALLSQRVSHYAQFDNVCHSINRGI